MSQQLPGYEPGRSLTPREIKFSDAGSIQIPIIIDGTLAIDGKNTGFTYEIRAGWLMGKTNSGRWVPCKRTRANGASGGSSNSIVVHDSSAFRVGDAIDVAAAANRTITAIDYQTDTITFNGSATTWSDNAVVVARDGSQTCRGILLDFVRLRNASNTQPVNNPASLLIQGAVKTDRLLGDVAAIRADPDAKLAGIRFSDDYGL